MDVSLNKPTVVELLDRGSSLHNAGDFLSAECDYMQILLEQPNHPEANHNLAIVINLARQPRGCSGPFENLFNASPNVSLFWATYIDVLS